MSGALKMNGQSAKRLGEFLYSLTKATVELGWVIDGAVLIAAPKDGGSITIRWDENDTEYVVDERVGS